MFTSNRSNAFLSDNTSNMTSNKSGNSEMDQDQDDEDGEGEGINENKELIDKIDKIFSDVHDTILDEAHARLNYQEKLFRK